MGSLGLLHWGLLVVTPLPMTHANRRPIDLPDLLTQSAFSSLPFVIKKVNKIKGNFLFQKQDPDSIFYIL